MATIYRKTYTKPLPPDAEVSTRKGERVVRWKDRKGKKRAAKVTTGKDGTERIIIKAGTYTAKYRDGSGIVREVATGCRSKDGAHSVLKGLVERAELVKSNILTGEQEAVADQQGIPLQVHLDAYGEHLLARNVTRVHRKNVGRYLERLASECSFLRLSDLNRTALERWLVLQSSKTMSARSRNAYLSAALSCCNWCVATQRLASNPFKGMERASEKADPRRQRRALTEDELLKLLGAARRRPLEEALTVRRGAREGQPVARLSEETRRRLNTLGRERALIYKTLVLTGLRRGELESITVGQLELDSATPYAVLDAADEKNRQGSDIPLRRDLASDLREWLEDKLRVAQDEARRLERQIPVRLPPDTPLFIVPTGLVRILDRDLRLAGIPKRDERGRTVDVHALRTTFGTLLSKGGVAPRTAQAAMRHSKLELTMNTYTDPKLLDIAGALDRLPGWFAAKKMA